jgi:predicted transcriptional regulator
VEQLPLTVRTQGFFNTPGLTGEELKDALLRTSKQEARILRYMMRHKNELFTPFNISDKLDILFTSARRALTNLTTANLIEKTSIQRTEKHGVLNHCWRYTEPRCQQKSNGLKKPGTP